MLEWDNFQKIVKGQGMWLIDSEGNKLLDGVGSMWCNVWGHSKKELVSAIIKQTKKIQHSSLFNSVAGDHDTAVPDRHERSDLPRKCVGSRRLFYVLRHSYVSRLR